MSKVRNLPELTTPTLTDVVYAVDLSVSVNGGRKLTLQGIKDTTALTASEVKTLYESNPDTNDFTDAEKTKLAGIEPGATADQTAADVPYVNTTSGLSATNVQDAIDEVSTATLADFKPSVVSGRILHYTSGTARFDDVFFSILAGDILLDPNITLGEVYLDLDGIVKQTGSGVNAPPLTIVFAKFSTDLNDITSLTDERVKNSQNLVRGLLADIRDVRAGASASAGSSGRLSDAMHKHNILTGAASTQTPDQANAEGTSANLARADHGHDIPTAAPSTTLSPATSNSQGAAASFANSAHTHAVATALVGDITTIQPDDSASAGTANTFSRGDHRHAIAASAPVATGTANSEGASTSFARSDHVHDTVISNSSVSATADDTTTSTTDVLLGSMTITPAAGTYRVTFNTSTLNSANGVERNYFSIYSGGSQVTGSERKIGIAGGAYASVSTQATVTVNGSQTIETRWRVIAGTGTAAQRSMSILRISS